MSCYQLIITITISHKSKSFIWKRAVVKYSIQSLESEPPQSYKVTLELVTIVIVITVVIVGFSGEDLRWLAHITVQLRVSYYSQLSDYTVWLPLCRLIIANFSSLCTNHIWRIVIVMIIINKRGQMTNCSLWSLPFRGPNRRCADWKFICRTDFDWL